MSVTFVMTEASNGQEAIDRLRWLHERKTPPDAILMDIRMPGLDGVAATKAICQEFPGMKILILTTFDDARYVAEALKYGAKGYLLKDTPAAELAEAIRSVDRGYTQFGPGILEKIVARVPTIATETEDLPPGMSELTAREREILLAIAAGSSNREIAQALFLSEGTVRNHISHILDRLDVRDRTQAAILANAFLPWLQGQR